ncbi:unnamed protein product [Victoria cruziana]
MRGIVEKSFPLRRGTLLHEVS